MTTEEYRCIECRKDISDVVTDEFKEVWNEGEWHDEKMCLICLKKYRINNIKTDFKMRYCILTEEQAEKFYNENMERGHYGNHDAELGWSAFRKDKIETDFLKEVEQY